MKYKIYRIVDNTNGNVYIGITIREIKVRIGRHKGYIKSGEYCSSSIILENNDWYYELVEETDDPTREAFHIQNTPNCINKVKFSYKYDYSEYGKEWRLNNKEYTKNYNEKYCLENKTKLNKHSREYHQKNKVEKNKRRGELQRYCDSWGGNKRSNNNLLCIDLDIFD